MAKKAVQKGAAAPSPLNGCTIAIAGTFPGINHAALQDRIESLGATFSKTVTSTTTFLIATQKDFENSSSKIKSATANGVTIVTLDWLEDCELSNTKADEKMYLLSAAPTSGPKQPNGSNKRSASPVLISSTSPVPAAQPPKKRKITGSTQSVAKVDTRKKQNAAATQVPLDETCPLSNYRVHIDDEGTIWDASLNQTNASNNANKFYRIQLLGDRGGTDFKTWTRWGRVGERGQNAILGGGSLSDAIRQFEKKFKDKSGLKWADRGSNPKAGKYAYIERNYGEDSENEDDGIEESLKTSKDIIRPKPAECSLDGPTRQLMELIFNKEYFAVTMHALKYDANKLPLGKLGKTTINRGFQVLKDLAALLDDPSLAPPELSVLKAIEQLSNSYYTLIPHAFGRNRPPVIQSNELLKQELELLENLGDMKEAAALMRSSLNDDGIHPLDRQFQGLGMDQMEALDVRSDEFAELSDYLMKTRGDTHYMDYRVQDIFRIQRKGEFERFDQSPYATVSRNRRLLWHGSRVTNFGGILGQGLRIAPPEAPVSGYMFGKGIYLADMSSKSANYCYADDSGDTALLLLCEAELGNPMQELIHASYTAGEDAKVKGLHSTWGKGRTGPSKWKDANCVHPSLAGVMMPDVSVPPGRTDVKDPTLLYNEYICYDVAQVRLRYLLRVNVV